MAHKTKPTFKIDFPDGDTRVEVVMLGEGDTAPGNKQDLQGPLMIYRYITPYGVRETATSVDDKDVWTYIQEWSQAGINELL